MHLKPRPKYSLVAPGLPASQCSAIARHPHLDARVSASAINFVAIPLRRSFSRTATFDTYAMPLLKVSKLVQTQAENCRMHTYKLCHENFHGWVVTVNCFYWKLDGLMIILELHKVGTLKMSYWNIEMCVEISVFEANLLRMYGPFLGR